MRIGGGTAILAALCACATAVRAADPPMMREIATAPDPVRLEASVRALVGFGTRHTASETASTRRGIGAARRWAQSRFEEIGRKCGGCLSVSTPAQTVQEAGLPGALGIIDVVAVQRGDTDPDRVIVLTGHIDSRVSDIGNATADAPGADDDASGVAVVIEAARVLSRYRFPATLVYGVLSGEEQGLFGGKLLAATTKAQNWRIEADLNNDIVGATRGQNGSNDSTRLRVFSESTRAQETAAEAEQRRNAGGESDSPSRNVARYAKAVAEHYLPNWTVALVNRADRVERGGDHLAFNEAGYPAVRFTENAEDYRHQHQDVRVADGIQYGDTIDHIDFAYLARVTATNALLAAALARAPAPPVKVSIGGAVTPDTRLSWATPPGPAVARYRVYWRDSGAQAWEHGLDVALADTFLVKGVVIDDHDFGVASVSADGFESPVVFPGPAGAF
jgi:Zn-dependent M28 family amino/carboxypeptidase